MQSMVEGHARCFLSFIRNAAPPVPPHHLRWSPSPFPGGSSTFRTKPALLLVPPPPLHSPPQFAPNLRARKRKTPREDHPYPPPPSPPTQPHSPTTLPNHPTTPHPSTTFGGPPPRSGEDRPLSGRNQPSFLSPPSPCTLPANAPQLYVNVKVKPRERISHDPSHLRHDQARTRRPCRDDHAQPTRPAELDAAPDGRRYSRGPRPSARPRRARAADHRRRARLLFGGRSGGRSIGGWCGQRRGAEPQRAARSLQPDAARARQSRHSRRRRGQRSRGGGRVQLRAVGRFHHRGQERLFPSGFRQYRPRPRRRFVMAAAAPDRRTARAADDDAGRENLGRPGGRLGHDL